MEDVPALPNYPCMPRDCVAIRAIILTEIDSVTLLSQFVDIHTLIYLKKKKAQRLCAGVGRNSDVHT